MFYEVDNYMNRSFSYDYWEDQGIEQALIIMRDFNESDWLKLNQAVYSRGEGWLARCAQVVGEIPSRNALEILVNIVGLDHKESTFYALESIGQLFAWEIPISEEIKELLINKTIESIKNETGIMKDILINIHSKLSE